MRNTKLRKSKLCRIVLPPPEGIESRDITPVSQLAPRERLATRKIASAANGILGITALALAGVLLSAGCKAKEAAEPAPLVTVEVAPAEVMSVERKVTADAVLFPLRQSAIVPKISAPVGKFHVERGSHVRAGQLLAELESQDLAGAAAESRGGYEQAETAYEIAVKTTVPEEMRKAELDAKSAKESADALQKVYDSRKSLLQQGAISGKEVDDSLVSLTQARNTYEIAQKHLEMLQSLGKDQEIKTATAQLAAAKGRLQNAEAQLSYTKIVSPIDGFACGTWKR